MKCSCQRIAHSSVLRQRKVNDVDDCEARAQVRGDGEPEVLDEREGAAPWDRLRREGSGEDQVGPECAPEPVARPLGVPPRREGAALDPDCDREVLDVLALTGLRERGFASVCTE